MKKRIKKHIEVITPLKKRCVNCGKRVTNHHFLCDKCWGRKAKRKYWIERRRLCKKKIK